MADMESGGYISEATLGSISWVEKTWRGQRNCLPFCVCPMFACCTFNEHISPSWRQSKATGHELVVMEHDVDRLKTHSLSCTCCLAPGLLCRNTGTCQSPEAFALRFGQMLWILKYLLNQSRTLFHQTTPWSLCDVLTRTSHPCEGEKKKKKLKTCLKASVSFFFPREGLFGGTPGCY